MNKKVVFLIRDLNYAGAQRQLVTLVTGLDRQKFDVTVLYFYPDGPLEKDLRDSNIKTICLDKGGRWDLFKFMQSLRQHLNRIQPHILHGYLGEANLLVALLKPFYPATKMVLGLRGSYEDIFKTYGWLSVLLFQIERFTARLADLIIVNSYAGKDYHVRAGYPAAKTIVIHNGIDTEKFKIDSEARARVRSEWRIKDDEILIGLVSRLYLMKDHPNFLKAAALGCQKRQNIRFVCVGIGPEDYTQELQQLTEELGIVQKVIWAGARSDMPAVQNAIDIAVSASANGEGFSNVIGEAMACGTPCIVTDVGDSASIVGELGIVVPPKDPEALSSAIDTLVDRLGNNQYKSEQIRQRIVDNFSVSQLVTKTEKALLGICS
ncbi:MAG: glycosyltransferase [Cyanosarcina radialis HA8281-LM2]|jgi:glycosyltransferase involved in cell wall biosynthesis|nr:glycosyltransferase [Cyanosarcina radialis HA8281-LM2]